jgi:hypothetical protein
MRVFLTDEEVLELAYWALDMCQPNPDRVHDIALKMDMVYNEDVDMYEDVEDVYIRFLRHRLTSEQKAVYENKMIVRPK